MKKNLSHALAHSSLLCFVFVLTGYYYVSGKREREMRREPQELVD